MTFSTIAALAMLLVVCTAMIALAVFIARGGLHAGQSHRLCVVCYGTIVYTVAVITMVTITVGSDLVRCFIDLFR